MSNYDYPTPKHGLYAKRNLRAAIRAAQKLETTLQDDDQLPAWVQGYIATAADRLAVARDNVGYAGPQTPAQRSLTGVTLTLLGLLVLVLY